MDTVRNTPVRPAPAPPVSRPGSRPHTGELAVRERIRRIEEAFGDPWDPHNPTGHAALLEADARRAVPWPGLRALERAELTADLVPDRLGGRLARADGFARILRHVFRRDASLGIGHGLMSYMAATHVWTAGDAAQQRRTARLLLGGGWMTNAYHEVAHSNDLLREEYRARRVPGGYRLSGRKHAVFNGARADALTLVCRTADGPGTRNYSLLLVSRAGLDPERARELPRQHTHGVRSCHVAGLDLRDCPVDDGCLIGAEGDGVRLTLRSFQAVRGVAASALIGVADTALRTAVRHALREAPGERPRSVLAGAFADVLLCDALALAATRALHLLPEQTSVLAACAKYLVPRVLDQALHDLSSVLGARRFERTGEAGFFQKAVRDLPVVGLGHAGTAACQAIVVPQLRQLASRSWLRDECAPAALFRPGADLPAPAAAGLLSLTAPRETVSGWLTRAGGAELRPAGDVLLAEFRALGEVCRALDAKAPRGGPALADRYALLLAAAAVVAVHTESADPFLADPAWARAALTRIAHRLGHGVPGPTEPWAQPLGDELLRRGAEQRTFDLYATPVPG
ncbi:acyl-CoA dehydrogenase [Streptomyces sp. NPDC002076]